jgi:hypothetical protein
MQERVEDEGLDISNDATIWTDLGIVGLFRKIQNRKWMLVLIPLLWLVFSNVAFRVLSDVYSGELQVVPGNLGETTMRAGGLADLISSTGVGALLPGGTSTDGMFGVYVESWTAPWFADDLLANKELTQKIFAREWSAETGQWVEPEGLLTTLLRRLKAILGAKLRPWTPPDAERMLAYLREHIKTQRNRGDIMTSITVEAKDPVLARELLQYGHKHIGEHLAKIFQERADANIAYLTKKLAEVSVADYRRALANDLEQQEKMKMMAFANPEFAAQSLGIFSTTNPIRPNVTAISLVTLFLSIVVYCGLVLLTDRSNGRKA